ncbi:PspC domain-containing protein [Pseudonocardia sp. KRD291]|uniref:PspC domain-containing protein n=1 Tax=Pseudonocardia sp. KRD291 TaxID=2792007 RepID=UPI001C4A0307|nr:PspC domain-containing protein [Pseudonocardia sp. KRD291]MBW0103250.1 PspC domain-containing protein [Pseudonocardia sp. KRD291]
MDTTENRTGTDPTTPEIGEAAAPYAASPGVAVLSAAGPPARERRRFTLRRSRTDVMLGGVCGGLAGELEIDPALLRIATVTLTLFTGGGLALVYLAAWILAPREDPAVGAAV